MLRGFAFAAVLAAALTSSARARTTPPETVDLVAISRIREEGFARSKVMDTAQELTDVIGPRLTGSPAMKRANEWTRKQFADWGLANARVEKWGHFGRGWSVERSVVTMVTPSVAPLVAYPKAWTPGTEGAVRGAVKRARISSKTDFDRYKGKLEGTVVFLSPTRALTAPEKAAFRRYDDSELADLARYDIADRERDFSAFRARRRFQRELMEFLTAEKALAVVEASDRDGGIVRVAGAGSREKDESAGVPSLVMSAEHYNRVLRLVQKKEDVALEIDVKVSWHDDDQDGYNTLGEIPGTLTTGEVVMAGAHLDSWHSGTGATDNAAGSAIVMEAMRILKAIEARPRRTIRAALWSGEEQGLLGSRGYVEQHFAVRSDAEEARKSKEQRRPRGPLAVKPEHAKLSAYFNIDNGTGRLRGIYAQENAAVVPIFKAWLEPLADLGATTVTSRDTGSTDHVPFDEVGLPGFQFIQDQADYSTRTHHTNLDVFDRLQKEDLMQASVVLASFLYQAAMRDEPLPRKPLTARELGPQPSPSPEASPDPEAEPEPEASPSPSPRP
ncbi:MAG: M20/M25/M40 family metallo-hydrolase [Vicinamibacteria bacterium]